MAIEQHTASKSRFLQALAWIPPQYALLAIFGTLLIALRLTFGRELSTDIMSVRYAFWMMIIFSTTALLRQLPLSFGETAQSPLLGLRRSAEMLVDWFPFVLCLWVYENLHDLTLWIRPDTVDQALAAADLWLFGVQPTIWLESFAHPLLSDYLALSYMTYFVFPPLLAGWLYLRGDVEAFKEFQLGLLVTFYCGFLGYITVPAVGPRLVIKSYAGPLSGRYFYWGAARVISGLQSFARDCFPSLHTAVSSVTLYFLFRQRKLVPLRSLVLAIVTLLTASLWLSTVYLRYHWVVDVLAGWLLSALASAAGTFLHRRWPKRQKTGDDAPPPGGYS